MVYRIMPASDLSRPMPDMQVNLARGMNPVYIMIAIWLIKIFFTQVDQRACLPKGHQGGASPGEKQ